MPKKPTSRREQFKLPVFDAKGRSKTVSVSRLELKTLVSELGFDSPAAFFKANADLFYLFGHKKELALPPAKGAEKKEEKPLSPEEIERALRILLRAIALASGPQLAGVPPPEEETVDGRPAVEVTHKVRMRMSLSGRDYGRFLYRMGRRRAGQPRSLLRLAHPGRHPEPGGTGGGRDRRDRGGQNRHAQFRHSRARTAQCRRYYRNIHAEAVFRRRVR